MAAAIEEVLKKQEVVSDEIQRLYHRVLGFDTIISIEDHDKTKEKLLEKYAEFQENHAVLKEDQSLKKAKYIKDNVEATIKTIVSTTLTKLEVLREKSSKKVNFPEEKTMVENRQPAQSGLIRKFQFVLSDFMFKVDQFNLGQEICENVEEARKLAQNVFLEYVNNFKDDDLTEQFYSVKADWDSIPLKIKRESNRSAERSVDLQAHYSLPAVEIPYFDGDYSKWNTFKELFEELIGSKKNIPDVQKMCILKSKLKGSAASCVSNLPATSTNFEVAWEILDKKFTNKRLLASMYFKKIIEAPEVVGNRYSVRKFSENIQESIQALKVLKLSSEDLLQAFVNYILVRKLNEDLRLKYENSLKDSREIQNVDSLIKFLDAECYALEAAFKSGNTSARILVDAVGEPTEININRKCIMGCKIAHTAIQCPRFRQLSTSEKWNKVMAYKLCVKCLKSGHTSKICSGLNCKNCNGLHHSMLHQDKSNAKSAIIKSNSDNKCVLLTTARVKVKTQSGQFIEARALLDSGSQVSLITRSLKNKLGINSKKEHTIIEGIGKNKSNSNERVNIYLKSKTSNYNTNIDVLVVPNILSNLPSQKIVRGNIPNDINLADPEFDIPGKVDILLGAELFYTLIKHGKLNVNNGEYILQNTVFGWMACGSANIERKSVYCGIVTQSDESLQNKLNKFWELEEIQNQSSVHTVEEKECERIFNKTIKRGSDGKFIVALPFKGKIEDLGDSSLQAKRRFYALERRFSKDESLRFQYKEFMREYLQLGHMEMISDIKKYDFKVYLPHHCVLRQESLTTKLRVVFDAACKTSKNNSLNELLYTGPKLQEDLFNILLRFRKHRYVFSADIEKMYRQIWVAEEDRKYQLIYWRWNEAEPLKTFALKTVTYGTSCAPYLAVKCLQESADKEKVKYPAAANVIKSDFYMDDLMTGGESLEEVMLLQKQISDILGNCGFSLRKWCANDTNLLKKFPEKDKALQLNIDMDQADNVKTLGIVWVPKQDNFLIKCNLSFNNKITKRNILSDISKLFDPLGLISPVIITTKILIQELWKLKIDWDEDVSNKIEQDWLKIKEQFPMLSKLTVPRRIICNKPKRIELHGFCDASMKAYGAVVYVKSIDDSGNIYINIAAAKSRVAPTKVVTLPRLELCAAVLLVELTRKILESLKTAFDSIYLYSDSEIVLSWLKLDPATLQVFVSNRVSFIQSNFDITNFKHVRSKDNPADLISRGLLVQDLIDNKLWFEGPESLKSVGCMTNEFSMISRENIPEIKKAKIVACIVTRVSIFDNINHKNNFEYLQGVVAQIIKFKDITLKKPIKSWVNYRKEALQVLIKKIQAEHFAKERKLLLANENVPNNSKLATLCPLVDNEGIIRVGGRLENSKLSYSAKHPILLPYDNKWVQLLVENIHIKHLHVGQQGLLALVRQKYWPVRGRQLVKKIVGKCYRCFKANPRPLHQLMGNLPEDRLIGTRPFLNVGVDFLGPLSIHHKMRGKRIDKAYVCVFVCFATKAVHLEVVSDLSSAAFIGALKRFIARRSCPRKIYSDNGTNFVGAANSLQEIYKLFNEESHIRALSDFCVQNYIEWIFIPARSPHVGGLWEAAVKSVKKHLFKVTEGIMTFEEMCTLMAQIEAILNSRPLMPLTEDPNSFLILTPAHFLVGEPLSTIADSSDNKSYHGLRGHWKTVEKNTKEFWKLWSTEYLSELQKRNKWKRSSENIKPGTLVLLKEDNTPPMNWRRGRVVNTIVGKDGKCRVVDIKTSTGETKRSIHNICPFPVDEEVDEKMKKNEEKEKNIVRRSNRIKKKCNNLSALIALLTVFPIISCKSSIQDSVNINNLKNQAGIFFESRGSVGLVRTYWNIMLHADLTDYWAYKSKLEGWIGNMKKIEIQAAENSLAITTMEQLLSRYDRIQNNHKIIFYNQQGRPQRVPRAILPFVGTVYHSLFGLMDEEHAEKLEQKIIQGRKNEEYLMKLLQNQSSIQDITENFMRKQNEVIWKNFETLSGSMYQLTDTINHQLSEDMFFNAASTYVMALESFEVLQRDMIDLLWNAKSNFLERLLPIDKFQKHISDIIFNIEDSIRLPDTNPLALGHIATLTGRTMNNSVIFNIKIPLIHKEKLDSFAIYPYPTIHDGFFVSIRPEFRFILLDERRSIYYGLAEEEMFQCQRMEQLTLCPQTHPLYNINTARCEVELFLRKRTLPDNCVLNVMPKKNQYWRQLHAANSWIFSVCEDTPIDVTCGEGTATIILKDQGIMQLKPDCRAASSEVNLWASDSYQTKVQFNIPFLNISEHLPPLKHIKIRGDLETFKIPQIPRPEMIFGLPMDWDIDFHDVIHYGMSATNFLLLVAAVIIIVVILRRLCATTASMIPIGGFTFGR